jgi:hypothetical protein
VIPITGGMTDQTRLVVRDSATWMALSRQLYPEINGRRPHAVDFERFMLVVVAFGGESAAVGGVQVDSVVRRSGRAVVYSTTVRRGSGCLVPSVFITPTVVLRIPTRFTVRFVESEQVEPAC